MTESHDVTAALPETTHEAAVPEAPKMVPQDKVNELVRDAFNRGMQKRTTSEHVNAPSHNVNAMISDPEHISRMVADAFDKKKAEYDRRATEEMQRKEGERILNELKTKVQVAASKHEDYDKVTGQHDWSQMPEVLHLANTVDNAGDVLYDLSKNESKLATIRGLPPVSAALAIKKLSDSIKLNEQAEKDAKNPPPEPGSQFRPSNFGGDKKPTTAADYAAKYRGRG